MKYGHSRHAHAASPLRGFVWAVLIVMLFVFFFSAVASHSARRRFHPRRMVWPGGEVMLDQGSVHHTTVERSIPAR